MDIFIKSHVAKVKPLFREVNLAYWNAAVTGKTEHYEKVKEITFKIRQIYSDANDFAKLKEIKVFSNGARE